MIRFALFSRAFARTVLIAAGALAGLGVPVNGQPLQARLVVFEGFYNPS
jgi:hypothetical protein